MKSFKEYIKEKQKQKHYEEYVLEMAVISRRVLNKNKYQVVIHGTNSGDRPNPHVHIYLDDDTRPFSKFNFEISLCDILCHDEINLVRMKDKKKGLDIRNRDKCSWNNYRKLHDEFEDWLFNKPSKPGTFKDNLDAIIWYYNNESVGTNNYIKEYIKEHGLKVLPKYKEYVENNNIY